MSVTTWTHENGTNLGLQLTLESKNDYFYQNGCWPPVSWHRGSLRCLGMKRLPLWMRLKSCTEISCSKLAYPWYNLYH